MKDKMSVPNGVRYRGVPLYNTNYILFRKPHQKKSSYERISDSDNNDPREYNEKTKLIDDDKQNDPHKNKLKQLLVILHLA